MRKMWLKGERVAEEKFILTAIAATLTAGASLGAWYLTGAIATGAYGAPGGALIQAHAHVQLFAWVGLFIMGMAYIIIPRFKATTVYSIPMQTMSYLFMTLGIILWVASYVPGTSFLALVAPALELAGAALFGYNLLRTSLKGERLFWDKFLYAGLAWFVAIAAYGLYLLPILVRSGPHEMEELTHVYYLLIVFGFVANTIMAVGLHTLPAFLGAKTANPKSSRTLFFTFNLSVVVLAVSMVVSTAPPIIVKLAMAGIIGSLASFVVVANVFRKPETDLGREFALETSYMRFLPAAYFWLLISLVMFAVVEVAPLAEVGKEALESVALHALAFGFVTGMIFGYGTKAIPVVEGTSLYSPALNNLTYYVYILATTTRVLSQAAYGFGWRGIAWLLAVAGILQLLAVALFAYNIGRTALKAGREEDEELEDFANVGPLTIIYDVLAKHPETLSTFVDFGFQPLTNPVARRTIAKTVSIRTVARMRGIDEAKLLDAINAQINDMDTQGGRAS